MLSRLIRDTLVLISVLLSLAFAGERSGHWPVIRKHHLEREPACVACGETSRLEVHHIIPVHLGGAELVDENLITLCERHHFDWGHLRDWKAYNPDVRDDCRSYRKKMEGRRYERPREAIAL